MPIIGIDPKEFDINYSSDRSGQGKAVTITRVKAGPSGTQWVRILLLLSR